MFHGLTDANLIKLNKNKIRYPDLFVFTRIVCLCTPLVKSMPFMINDTHFMIDAKNISVFSKGTVLKH